MAAERANRWLFDDLEPTTMPLPVAMPDVPLYLTWQQCYDSDHAHKWLRTQAIAVMQALQSPRT